LFSDEELNEETQKLNQELVPSIDEMLEASGNFVSEEEKFSRELVENNFATEEVVDNFNPICLAMMKVGSMKRTINIST
jgi:hypothetical protein